MLCLALLALARLTSPIPSRLFASDFRATSPPSVRSLLPVAPSRPPADDIGSGSNVDYRDTPCASSPGFPAPPLLSPSCSILGTPLLPCCRYLPTLTSSPTFRRISTSAQTPTITPGAPQALCTYMVLTLHTHSLIYTHAHAPTTSLNPRRHAWPSYILIANMHTDYRNSSLPCHLPPSFPLTTSSGLRRHSFSSQVVSSA